MLLRDSQVARAGLGARGRPLICPVVTSPDSGPTRKTHSDRSISGSSAPSERAPFSCRVTQARVPGFGWGHLGQNLGVRLRLAARGLGSVTLSGGPVSRQHGGWCHQAGESRLGTRSGLCRGLAGGAGADRKQPGRGTRQDLVT